MNVWYYHKNKYTFPIKDIFFKYNIFQLLFLDLDNVLLAGSNSSPYPHLWTQSHVFPCLSTLVKLTLPLVSCHCVSEILVMFIPIFGYYLPFLWVFALTFKTLVQVVVLPETFICPVIFYKVLIAFIILEQSQCFGYSALVFHGRHLINICWFFFFQL